MFEHHGWITLANSAQGEPRERAGELKAITALVERLGGPYLADMRYMNGTRFIHLAGFPTTVSRPSVSCTPRWLGDFQKRTDSSMSGMTKRKVQAMSSRR